MRSSSVWWCVLFLLALTMPSCGKRDTYGSYEEQQKRQQDALSTLRGQGAKMEEKKYDFPTVKGKAWVIDLTKVQITAEVFDQLDRLTQGQGAHISELNLSHTNVSDNDMARLNSPPVGSVLLKLDLSHTAISDAGLGQLTNLMFLGELNLTGTKVTEAGVGSFLNNRAADQRILKPFKSPKIQR